MISLRETLPFVAGFPPLYAQPPLGRTKTHTDPLEKKEQERGARRDEKLPGKRVRRGIFTPVIQAAGSQERSGIPCRFSLSSEVMCLPEAIYVGP